jgi:hypothetical protein
VCLTRQRSHSTTAGAGNFIAPFLRAFGGRGSALSTPTQVDPKHGSSADLLTG